MEVFLTIMGIALVVGIILSTIAQGASNPCPKCGTWWPTLANKELLEAKDDWATETDCNGNKIVVPIWRNVYVNHWRCKCQHEWTTFSSEIVNK